MWVATVQDRNLNATSKKILIYIFSSWNKTHAMHLLCSAKAHVVFLLQYATGEMAGVGNKHGFGSILLLPFGCQASHIVACS